MNEIYLILFISIVQGAIFDFGIYYGIFREYQITAYYKYYWLWKFLFDFPVTIFVSVYLFHISFLMIGMFYLFKWFGFCDFFYQLMWSIIRKKWYDPQGELFWYWDTPLGLLRTFIEFLRPKAVKRIIKFEQPLNWWKGIITMKEYYFQLAIGIIINILITIIF